MDKLTKTVFPDEEDEELTPEDYEEEEERSYKHI